MNVNVDTSKSEIDNKIPVLWVCFSMVLTLIKNELEISENQKLFKYLTGREKDKLFMVRNVTYWSLSLVQWIHCICDNLQLYLVSWVFNQFCSLQSWWRGQSASKPQIHRVKRLILVFKEQKLLRQPLINIYYWTKSSSRFLHVSVSKATWYQFQSTDCLM